MKPGVGGTVMSKPRCGGAAYRKAIRLGDAAQNITAVQ